MEKTYLSTIGANRLTIKRHVVDVFVDVNEIQMRQPNCHVSPQVGLCRFCTLDRYCACWSAVTSYTTCQSGYIIFICCSVSVNPLVGTGNYSATSNNMKPTHQRPVYQSPYCCIMVRCCAVLMCPLKG